LIIAQPFPQSPSLLAHRSVTKLIPSSFEIYQACNSVLGRVADSEFETNSYVAAAYKKIGWQDKLTDLMEKAEIRATDMNSLINMKLKIKGCFFLLKTKKYLHRHPVDC
jgi:hypothetical protein